MLLNEFFGKNLSLRTHSSKADEDTGPKDDIFWYILHHDKLHKDYFYPLAKKIKRSHTRGSANRSELIQDFFPMVNQGCREYYAKKKLEGKMSKLFPRDLREELCEKLYDHYCEDILKGKYKLGI